MSFLNKETPSDISELFKDALINNTFNERCLSDSLKMEIENSYSYLYRLQRNMIRYQRFHFQTKEKDLKMSQSDIELRLEEIKKELNDSSTTDERKEELLSENSELTRVDYGDYFLDEKYRACMLLDFDLINNPNREDYKMSEYFHTELTMDDLISHPDIFAFLPLIMVDHQVYFDCKFRMDNGTLVVIFPFGETMVYTKQKKQIFHDTCIMFVDNIYCQHTTMSKIQLEYYSIDRDSIPNHYPYYEKQPATEDGIYFSFIRYGKNSWYIPFIETKRRKTDAPWDQGSFVMAYPESVKNIIESYDSFDFYTIFFPDLKKYQFYTGDYVVSDRDLFVIQRSDNVPYAMPVPENSFIVMQLDGDMLYPEFGLGVELHYPNIYTIEYEKKARSMGECVIYYHYHEADFLKYTRMHEFYYRFLMHLGNDTTPSEEIFNLIYHNKIDQIANYDWIQDKERFSEVVKFINEYKIDQQLYSINDFLIREKWTAYPINYVTNKMKKFIKNDFNVLRNYARHVETHGLMMHLYASSIDTTTRFRSSTFFESPEEVTPLFTGFHESDEDHGILVVSDEDQIEPFKSIHQSDFKAFEDIPEIGSYVELDGYDPCYVFMLRPRFQDKIRKLRIFIDGLYVGYFLTMISEGCQFLYLPVRMIHDNSYILLEELFETTQVTKHTFTEDDPKFTLNVIGNEFSIPTTEDVFILDQDGYEVPYESYKIHPILKGSSYTTHLEDGTEARTHASVFTSEIVMTDSNFMNQECEIYIGKKFERYHRELNRTSFPRITLHEIYTNRNINHLQIWKNGRLVPENLYKQENFRQFGIYRIQMLEECKPGDVIDFEFSPYTHKQVGLVDGLGEGGVLNLANYFDKPASIDYYDFYINGKRLGLPNVYQVGRTGVTFTNLKSTFHLELFERERDEEYFGFELGDETYFYDELDFINEPFLRKEDRELAIKEIIDNQKDPRTVIEPNTDDEEHITIENLPSLEESSKIFYYEELLPLGLLYPDVVQFDKAYFKFEYPDLASMYLTDYEQVPDLENGEVIMLQPDFNIEAPMENTIVMLFGENEIND